MIISSKRNENSFKSILNFGIDYKSRTINFLGFNGKFSEYDAAILDANFDTLNKRKTKIKKISIYLNNQIKNKNLIKQNNFGKDWFGLKLILKHKKKTTI